ncbi:DEAD/DEAH box helicase [Brevibacillus nitrificans]|uniref:DEAD/DEAH box helicase n=1 Tax=Brevibacillus nitrificans TaxID=651560 RepID=UPI00260E4527|nr:DEAD/DEAH box helicase [Brevibacillus nitrificans]MED1796586.1 DEAD/DEAH box helicase [Brevibacillus nitrificans]
MAKSFASFGFRPELMQGIQDLYYKEPTAIQEEAIPLILEGKDVIGQAQTGTGKTAAFMLPILNGLEEGKRDIQALILTPTRELSIQIAKEVEKLGKHLNVNVLSLHGGTDIDKQLNKLKDTVHIVVGTPGRVLDHMKRGSLHFGRISTLVLDEADKMMEMGFLEDVEQVVVHTPNQRQVLLFSATMPDTVKKLAHRFMKQPPHIKIEGKQKTVERIEQYYYVVNQSDKTDALVDLLEQEQPFLTIIFANTQVRVQQLTARLQENGLSAQALYGDLSQNKREQLMKQFRDIRFQYLIATDIAARGLDVEGVTHVINYDLPNDVESYIHRVGRTGRAGQKGKAISLISPRQKNLMGRIAKTTKATIEERILQAGRHLDEGRRQRAEEREAHFIELREQQQKELKKEKDKEFAPIREAIKKKTKVKPGYKKKLARELDELQTKYEQNRKRAEAIASRKAGKTAKPASSGKPAKGGASRPGGKSQGGRPFRPSAGKGKSRG